jgi:Holliday junction resolvase
MKNNFKEKEILITKASGETELFSEPKLRTSLKKAGASSAAIDIIARNIVDELQNGMSTKQIYSKALSYLRREERSSAGRYHLRSALMELGPSGHPFERFVGRLFEAKGFSTEVAVVVPGRCISHELDVVAHKDSEHIMVECKFHNHPGIKSDAKIALYVQARFEDIEKRWKEEPEHGTKLHGVWLVTNTKFTSDATKYAECVGMHALGWNYPTEGSLQELVERHNLHPVTCLTLLTRFHKQELLNQGVVLGKDILQNPSVLSKIGLTSTQSDRIIKEIHSLTKI